MSPIEFWPLVRYNLPMTRRQRTILFLGVAILFLITTPGIILYSQGYRFDWTSKKLTKTGALYLRTIPQSATVTLDGKIAKRTNFLFGSVLIDNLIPKKYTVQITKAGYHPWEKTLEVKEAMVTEAKNVILFPLEPGFKPLFENVLAVWPAPNTQELLLHTTDEGIWKLLRLNSQNNADTVLVEQQNPAQELHNIAWDQNSQKILLSVSSKEQIQNSIYLLSETERCPKGICSLDFLGQGVEKIAFVPTQKEKIVVLKQIRNSLVLFEADYMNKKIISPLGTNVSTFGVRKNSVVWLEHTGAFWEKSLLPNTQAQLLSNNAMVVDQETPYEIFFLGENIFLRAGETLFQWKSDERIFEEIFSQTKEISPAPDNQKIAVTNNSEIWIYFTNEEFEQPMRMQGEKLFLTRFSKKPENLQWIGSHHILFSVGETIKIAEIDERDRINIIDIGQFPKPKLFWSEPRKTLYLQSENKLYVSEKLIK